MSKAYRQRDAERMLQLMVATQGDNKSWTKQKDTLLKLLKS